MRGPDYGIYKVDARGGGGEGARGLGLPVKTDFERSGGSAVIVADDY